MDKLASEVIDISGAASSPRNWGLSGVCNPGEEITDVASLSLI